MTLTISFVALFVAAAIAWYSYWKPHAVKFAKSGYTPPHTSVFGELCFYLACRLMTFAAVGKVDVYGRENLPPKNARAIFSSNHQLPPDFAMVRRASGRHFRMLTAADQLTGFFGVISAFMGVISVAFGKGEGALAEAACVDVVAQEAGSLGIFPQGALLPNNVLRKKEFRPGVVRMAKAAKKLVVEAALAAWPSKPNVVTPAKMVPVAPVYIVPMAVVYRHDPVYADWTHTFLVSTRSMFLGLRNPKHWDPLFKLDVETLPADERAEVERLREVKLKAYRKSRVTNYGGVVVIGKPIEADTLPEDPLEAIEVVRLAIAELLTLAEKR